MSLRKNKVIKCWKKWSFEYFGATVAITGGMQSGMSCKANEDYILLVSVKIVKKINKYKNKRIEE